MPSVPLFVSIAIVVVVDVCIFSCVMGAIVGSAWNSLAKRHPARDPAPDAVQKSFQSIAIGVANFGMCVHVAVDDAALHLRPAKFLRMFGARGMSVPWDQVLFKSRRKMFGTTYVKVEIGSTIVTGQAWCMGLASGAPSDA